ncbi:Transcription initiation factor TFIID subunit 11 TBP-associated factor [Vigna angularis]|uniref:Transcription initiation factor TFIID subunit 11 TBP-associated factor n=2 Tax=Phaseolus angularis TaxID=3914 RepID=A0A8T0JSL9_PHAAN|nr:transcription initiation factor TFIID subunit 11 [Vigna angularis]KAG2381225.1 Transcription initiation factor TFIID subunit 11 TBP-associated factor [Vigna angularis]BAT96744.1 hypothetical protein VIGAN_09002700 [Vigna angularis var. angularis]
MKQSKDPFEAAFEESPPESPTEIEADTIHNHSHNHNHNQNPIPSPSVLPLNPGPPQKASTVVKNKDKDKDDEEEEEEDNMDVELSKLPSTGDPHKMAKMQTILFQFSEEQMSRYESFRRAGFQRANMKRLLASITGTQKISVPMTIVVSGIAKMFVGEVVETARIVMKERKESGPIRPCHLREAYRRLKLEGKVFKRSASRLFR